MIETFVTAITSINKQIERLLSELIQNQSVQGCIHTVASLPCSPALWNAIMCAKARYLFSCEHDVIRKGPEFCEQKGNVLEHCSNNYMFRTGCVGYSLTTSSVSSLIFSCLSPQEHPYTIKPSLPLFFL